MLGSGQKVKDCKRNIIEYIYIYIIYIYIQIYTNNKISKYKLASSLGKTGSFKASLLIYIYNVSHVRGGQHDY